MLALGDPRPFHYGPPGPGGQGAPSMLSWPLAPFAQIDQKERMTSSGENKNGGSEECLTMSPYFIIMLLVVVVSLLMVCMQQSRSRSRVIFVESAKLPASV